MFHQPFVIPSALFVVLAVPLVLGRVPRNRWYGVRTAKTLSDDRVWYPANRLGGWVLICAGAIYLAVAAILPTPPPPQDNLGLWVIHLISFVGPLIIGLLLLLRAIRRLWAAGVGD